MIDSVGELKKDSKDNFPDCFEDENDIIFNVDNGIQKSRHQQLHDTKNLTLECKQADLLHWHYHLEHLSFKTLKVLDVRRILLHCLTLQSAKHVAFHNIIKSHGELKVNTKKELA